MILQSFIFSTLHQYKQTFLELTPGIERQSFEKAAHDLEASWQLLIRCLEVARPEHLLLIVDAIDHLSTEDSDTTLKVTDRAYLTTCFNELLNLPECTVRILLTADNSPQHFSSTPQQQEQALVPYKSPSLSPLDLEEYRSPPITELSLKISMRKPIAVRFSELCMLYPLGSVVFEQSDGHYRAFVVESISDQPVSPSTSSARSKALTIRCWTTAYCKGQLVKIQRDFEIAYYSAAIPVDMLRLVPSAHMQAGGDVRNRLIQRGKRFGEFSKSVHYLEAKRSEADIRPPARVIVDCAMFAASRGNEGLVEDFLNSTKWAYRNDQGLFYKPIVYLTCPAYVPAYDLEINHWTKAAVDDLDSLPRFGQGVLGNINLDYEDGDLILDVAKMHSQGFSAFQHEYKPTDGHPTSRQTEGRAILLHGPPGSGKSYAVRAVADYLRIPVIRILGSTIYENQRPKEILQQLFGYAASWKAIILMEHIDQFLATQNPGNDIQNITIPSLIRQELMNTPALVLIVAAEASKIDGSFRSLVSLAVEFKPWTADRRYDMLKSLLKAAGVTSESPQFDEIMEWVHEDIASYESLDGRQLRNLVCVATTIMKANNYPLDRKMLKMVTKGLARLSKQH